MDLKIYSHDIKLLNAISLFRGDSESAYKLYNCISSDKARLVAKFILNPDLINEQSENEYALFAKRIIDENP